MKSVLWHEGGPLFAGDTEDHYPGWYLFDGENTPEQITVHVPPWVGYADIDLQLDTHGSISLSVVRDEGE